MFTVSNGISVNNVLSVFPFCIVGIGEGSMEYTSDCQWVSRCRIISLVVFSLDPDDSPADDVVTPIQARSAGRWYISRLSVAEWYQFPSNRHHRTTTPKHAAGEYYVQKKDKDVYFFFAVLHGPSFQRHIFS